MDISIVLLNWNAELDTINCLRTISGWTNIHPTIFVVDNASQDGNPAQIKNTFPDIHLILNQENLGFSGGTNCGIKAALKTSEAPILLLNNDASISEADIIKLRDVLAKEDSVGIAGPLLFNTEHPDQLISAGGRNPVLHIQTRVQKIAPFPIMEVHNVSGTAVLVRSSVFKRTGLLDESYFFSTEMADLCTRAKKDGYKSVIHTQAQAYHTISRSASHRATLYVYYIIRNRFLYIRKHYRGIPKTTLTSLWTIYSLALAKKLSVAGTTTTSRIVRLGLSDGLHGRFGGQNERVLELMR